MLIPDSGKLGSFLKTKRELAEISQVDLAKKLGYSSSQFVSNWERGLATPPLKSLAKICDLLDVDTKEIMDLVLNQTRAMLQSELGTRAAKKPRKRV